MATVQVPPDLAASYFDGQTAKAQAVSLRLEPDSRMLQLLTMGGLAQRSIAWTDVQWPERTRHGIRVAHFAGGGSVQCADLQAWDTWLQQGGPGESWVVKMQQSWRSVLLCMLLLALLGAGGFHWGIPLAAHTVVALMPASVDASLGESSLAAIDESLMQPSKLPAAEQARLRAAFAKALSAQPAGSVPEWQLLFRKSRIGPNALALPGGTMVMTDELVALVDADANVVTAVLAHEMGHVQHRHGVQMLVQASLLGIASSVVLGDFSSLLAAVPVLLGQASYSRNVEKQADAEAVRFLVAAGISPEVMVGLFNKLEAERKRESGEKDSSTPTDQEATPADSASWLGIAFASHPGSAERIAFFRQAARQMQSKP